MSKPALAAIGAVLIIGGGAALGFAVTRKPEGGMTDQESRAADSAIAQLDGDLKAARGAVHERATTLAKLLQVQAAVGTDAATAREDVAGGELKFDPQSGEVIELVQVPKGGQPVTLVAQPETAAHSPHADKAGSYAELAGDKLVVTDVAQVTPKYRANELDGYIVVSRSLELKPWIDRLVAASLAGHLDVGGAKLVIGAPAAGAVDKPMPLPSQPDFKVVVAAPPMHGGLPVPLAAGGGAGALAGLVLVFASMMGRREKTAAEQPIETRPTQATGPGVAAGTQPGALQPTGVALGAKPMQTGSMIGRWEVVRRLGSGGMADVFLARARGEAGFEKLVAVKVMHPHLARNQRAVDLFLDEARLAVRITHPNVVAIQDLGKIGEDYVIVMEYVEGVDLERLLMSARNAGRAVPVDVGLGILCRICDGLQAAHKATGADGAPLHIVHRDVKAANVLVSKQGGVKVVDFGIAKAASQVHMTVAGETKGTPSMMAPEQRVGDVVDQRADVYSVAAVGFEIVSGKAVNLDLAALAHLGIENWPHLPKPSTMRAGLPVELDDLLLGAMAYDRERRPADCATLEAAVEAIMKRYGLSATDKEIGRWVTTELAQLQATQDAVAGSEPTIAPNT